MGGKFSRADLSLLTIICYKGKILKRDGLLCGVDMRKIIITFSALLYLGRIGVANVGAQSPGEGQKLYATYCSGCHGDKGKGDGPAAKSLPVKPVDHTDSKIMNELSDKYLQEIISKGGTAVGKSSFMPSWGGQLNDKQVRDIVVYMRSIADAPSKK
jgi:cytochrome c oxidase cbb3-type subunit 3